MKNQKQISIKKIITQEPYRSFIKIFDMAYVLDTTGNIVHVTGSIKKNLGYTAKEVINTHFKDYIGIKEIPIALSVFKDIILGKEAKDFANKLLSNWYTLHRPLLTSALNIFNNDPKAVTFYCKQILKRWEKDCSHYIKKKNTKIFGIYPQSHAPS